MRIRSTHTPINVLSMTVHDLKDAPQRRPHALLYMLEAASAQMPRGFGARASLSFKQSSC